MTPEVFLRLGRVSNLPTVWTNMIAGIVLAGGTVWDLRAIPIFAALSLFYVGGMFLNDAYDAEIDAKERPERPIPAGLITQEQVRRSGFGMLAGGVSLLLWTGTGFAGGTGLWPFFSGIALAAAIIFYNRHHKGNPVSPLIMGICRVLVYVSAGIAFVAPPDAALYLGAALLLAYLIGLTYVAKQENLGRIENLWPLLFLGAPVVYYGARALENATLLSFWGLFTGWVLVALYFVKRRGPGDIPRAVVSLIAGISLLDALMIAGVGDIRLAIIAVFGFVLTLVLQKFVAGT
jgi:UbiA prenyltransferase family protein